MFKLWSSAHKQIILFGFHSGANKNTQYLEYFFCSFKVGKMMKGWTWNWKCFFNEVAFCITIKIRFEQLPVIKWEFNLINASIFSHKFTLGSQHCFCGSAGLISRWNIYVKGRFGQLKKKSNYLGEMSWWIFSPLTTVATCAVEMYVKF